MFTKLKMTCGYLLLIIVFATKSTFGDPLAATYNAPLMTQILSNPLMTDTATNVAYSCAFTDRGWNAGDWMFVRRSDIDSLDEWTQQQEYVENKSGDSNSYTSMVYKKKWRGDFTITAGMAFTDRMAPAVVLAWKLGTDAQGRAEYREHMEIVLWDQGVNVWLQRTENGKAMWIKTAYCQFPLQKNVSYQLQVKRKGAELSITVDDHTFGYRENALPDELYAGIAAAEGVNRLYNFAISGIKS